MLHTTKRLAALAAGCLLALPAILSAQDMPPEPLQAIGDWAEDQFGGAAHYGADGSALALWEQSAGDGTVLLAGRHRGWSEPATPPVMVSDQARWPMHIALDAVDGAGWVAVWDHFDAEAAEHVIRARDFDAQDVAVAAEYAVSTLPGRNWQPDAEYSSDGTRAFVWANVPFEGEAGIYARVFRPDGAMAQEIRLNVDPVWGADVPQLVRLASGEFLAVWTGRTADDSEEIFARRFDAEGNLLGAPFALSEAGGARETHPAIAIDTTGLPVAAWQASPEVRLRTLAADGTPLGAVLQVPRDAVDYLGEPAVARDADGDIALLYSSSRDSEAGTKVWLHRFAADGTPGPLLRLDYGDATESGLGVSSDADGDLFATWATSRETWPEQQYDFMLQHVRGANIAELSLSFTDNEVSIASGERLTYVARVKHEGVPTGVPGEGDTTLFGVSIDLPAFAVLEGIHQMDWACYNSEIDRVVTVSCTFEGNLAPGEQTYPVVVYARPPLWASRLDATASLAARRHPDPDPGNNTGYDITFAGDVEPDPIALADRIDVPRFTMQESDPFRILGIDVPVKISVSNGEYSIDNGPWTGEPGQISSHQWVRVRHESSASFSARVTTWLYVGTQADRFETITQARDVVPDQFAFADATGVAPGATMTSNLLTIAGLNDATPISVSGGSFSINGGTWRTHSGYAYNGDTVRVQHTAAATHATRTDTVLTVGGVSDTFSSTTRAADTVPDAFAFASRSNVARGVETISDEIVVSGIDAPAPIGVAGGSYSVDGGAFTAAAGTIANGQRVRLRHVSSSAFATATTTTLTIGGISAGFTSTTEAIDTVPDAFAFADRTGIATNVAVVSDAIPVAGINQPAMVSVSGGSYSINGGAFTTAAGTVNAGDQVRVQHLSSSAANAAVNTVLTVGGVSDTFTSTTGGIDNTPNTFAFVDTTGKKNKAVTSQPVTISGINVAVPVSVSGGGARWSKNGGAFTTAAGTVSNGDVVRLQVVAPSSVGAKVDVVVNIAGSTDTWTVTATN